MFRAREMSCEAKNPCRGHHFTCKCQKEFVAAKHKKRKGYLLSQLPDFFVAKGVPFDDDDGHRETVIMRPGLNFMVAGRLVEPCEFMDKGKMCSYRV